MFRPGPEIVICGSATGFWVCPTLMPSAPVSTWVVGLKLMLMRL